MRGIAPGDQLKWLVAFGSWSGSPLSAVQWQALRKEIGLFFALAPGRVSKRRGRMKKQFPVERLVAVSWIGWRKTSRKDLERGTGCILGIDIPV